MPFSDPIDVPPIYTTGVNFWQWRGNDGYFDELALTHTGLSGGTLAGRIAYTNTSTSSSSSNRSLTNLSLASMPVGPDGNAYTKLTAQMNFYFPTVSASTTFTAAFYSTYYLFYIRTIEGSNIEYRSGAGTVRWTDAAASYLDTWTSVRVECENLTDQGSYYQIGTKYVYLNDTLVYTDTNTDNRIYPGQLSIYCTRNSGGAAPVGSYGWSAGTLTYD